MASPCRAWSADIASGERGKERGETSEKRQTKKRRTRGQDAHSSLLGEERKETGRTKTQEAQKVLKVTVSAMLRPA